VAGRHVFGGHLTFSPVAAGADLQVGGSDAVLGGDCVNGQTVTNGFQCGWGMVGLSDATRAAHTAPPLPFVLRTPKQPVCRAASTAWWSDRNEQAGLQHQLAFNQRQLEHDHEVRNPEASV
jgi:hypothetical protein